MLGFSYVGIQMCCRIALAVLHSATGKRRGKTPVQRPVVVISEEKLMQGAITNNQIISSEL